MHEQRAGRLARLEARLRAEKQPNIKVTNLALGGWAYSTWIESGSLRGLAQQSDLVIVDLDVNAGIYIDTPVAVFQKDVDHTLFQLFKANPGVAVLAVDTFRLCSKDSEDRCLHLCPPEQQSAVNVTFGGSNSIAWCNFWWEIADLEAPLFSHYRVPVASYRNAVWPDMAAPSPFLPCFWNGNAHGDAISHLLAADVILHAIQRTLDLAAAAADCPAAPSVPVPFHGPTLPLRFCADSDASLTQLSVEQPQQFTPLFHTAGWEFAEDVAKKPGWIGRRVEGQNDSIAFAFALSSSPRLEVTFLKTYNNIGIADLAVYAGRLSAEALLSSAAMVSLQLNALELAQHWSLPKTIVVPTGGLTAGDYTVVLSVSSRSAQSPYGNKFKLLGITSC